MNKSKIIPIEYTADSIEHLGSNFSYIRRIFYVFRENMELLQNPDYQRLYDEAIDYLFRYAVKHCDWDEDKREWGYGCIEFLANLSISHNSYTEKYTIETVDLLLSKRRKIWNS